MTRSTFFCSTEEALKQVTSSLQVVWPIVLSVADLRDRVNRVVDAVPNIKESELKALFNTNNPVNQSVSYIPTFVKNSWEEQLERYAWILLNDIFAVYEGWIINLNSECAFNINSKNMQYAANTHKNSYGRKLGDWNSELNKCNIVASSCVYNAFDRVYSSNKKYAWSVSIVLC